MVELVLCGRGGGEQVRLIDNRGGSGVVLEEYGAVWCCDGVVGLWCGDSMVVWVCVLIVWLGCGDKGVWCCGCML